MFLDKNKAEPTLHQKIWCATESSKDGKEIASLISSIQKSVDTEDSLLLSKTLNNYVEGYAPQGQAEDLASGANFGHSFVGAP
jgi:DNA-binding FrmR family transcriptional regulator